MDTLLLSRIQFGANISFHILFPTMTIALGWMLLFFKLRFNATGDRKWMDAYMFWVKIFALSFAMGVVSGITMSFQFGTNWPGFMETVGNVAGPLLAYEIMTAFFLEAVFLGIMLFGASRVKPWVHTMATFLVAFGTTMSTFWIIVLNSWMHTPQGFELRDGVVHATDWLQIIFNPSMPYRFVHMMLASGLTVAFLIAGVSALRLLWGDRSEAVKSTLRVGIIAGAGLIPLQILAGDMHGLNTLEYQPAKVAAMEGNWETGPNVPLVLFAVPNQQTRSNDFEVAIPNGASLILKHSADGVVPGLNDFVSEDGEIMHPRVAPVFYGFRVMVGTGMAMLALSWGGLVLLRRYGAGNMPKLALYVFAGMSFSGWIATLAGWYTTEIGRQPWLVQGVLATKDAVSDVSSGMVWTTLVGYLVIYAALIIAYIGVITYLARKATHGDRLPTRDYPTAGAAAPAMLQPGE
ncbi:cytochrome ubiquinol oxidase subunit I [Loktanella sp. SALINAS62]|uniref:cytochrome ubiquinol oxidase subunit I n=1 Tax=Loktanella sp. SALINAS62 TaxID=2706124 RepID=UPI0032C49E9A|nr:cytochrome ubiquinol oxidase subunit I [Loktanella sp. SALINAS62]